MKRNPGGVGQGGRRRRRGGGTAGRGSEDGEGGGEWGGGGGRDSGAEVFRVPLTKWAAWPIIRHPERRDPSNQFLPLAPL